jgi:hypothetical protein
VLDDAERGSYAAMIENFELNETAPDALVIELPEHGLNGEATDLLDIATQEIGTGKWRSIQLEASKSAFVTLEGIAILVRLLKMGEDVDTEVRVASPNPILEQRLRLTGILEWLVSGRPSSRPAS